ncbi:putative Thioredoxin like [Trypanosoma vivax]|uniref:Thioredoxin-like fold domain-containing protein n=1 Tax=Trypanosoma vivax (strain Y486) TaxID=1055687 RepID=G0TR97_TRYVY|nr:putative Thioredoxin like [Trypanosoma vivax]CCC46461.1 conserved hypothetical protein [Trypanosoma vivax Y486]
MRFTFVARRTSRRGPGGWTEATLRQSATYVGQVGRGQESLHSPGAGMTSAGPSTNIKTPFGVNSFSMIDRQQMTFTRLIHLTLDATFKPKDPDSRTFGGDGATQRAALREELKTMDSRIVPFAHTSLTNNYLKNIAEISGPSGQICDREILRGRLVGLLFFTETERSLAFMQKLKAFHQKHRNDFIVVAISMGGKEMKDITQQHGFYHCTHRNGATWVKRDAGLMVRPWTPLPRLVVVNGTTGEEITSSGLTAVITQPETCFEEWRKGNTGHNWWDYVKVAYV